ncbi:iron ABC transporter permease [Wohlfahrtiimonas chitiniclastica]|uniref:FecCD family ABC transporter permease n=1 Tax=Wohlfahrtiimonas chitiniclastica TaxID=400946 RepID=UPI0031BA574A
MGERSLSLSLLIMVGLIICTVVISSYVGALSISWSEILNTDSLDNYIFWQIRLPRILAALLVGGAFAISGAVMQGLFRNPLVEPGIIGVSSGAAFFVALTIVLGGKLFPALIDYLNDYTLPVAACIGGWAVTAFLYYVSRHNQNVSVSSMLLVGIAINAFIGALLGLLSFVATDDQLRSLTFWSLGSLGGFDYSKLLVLLVIQLIVVPFFLLRIRAMNAMLLGEREARHLGINVERLKKQQIWGVAILTGSAVAFSGGIGFVGLVIPHLVRMLFGSDHRFVLPLSFLMGGLLLLIADSLSRVLAAPAEVPIGIFTAFIGAPFLGYLVYRQAGLR